MAGLIGFSSCLRKQNDIRNNSLNTLLGENSIRQAVKITDGPQDTGLVVTISAEQSLTCQLFFFDKNTIYCRINWYTNGWGDWREL